VAFAVIFVEVVMTTPVMDFFNPNIHFLGLLQKSLADGIARRCQHADGVQVYLAPMEQVYYSPYTTIEMLSSLCLAAPFDMQVKVLPNHWRNQTATNIQVGRMRLQRQNSDALPPMEARPLSELSWYATLHASQGRLLQGHSLITPVTLHTMPDFSRYFHQPYYAALASFMMTHNADLPTIAQQTQLTLGDVIDFYNACAVLGYLARKTQDKDLFNPQDYLTGLLNSIPLDQTTRRCELTGQTPLFIAPAEGKYYTEGSADELKKLCQARVSDIAVTLIDDHATQESMVQVGRSWVRRKSTTTLPKVPARALFELQFRATLYSSQGRLLVGHSLDAPVQLNNWSDKTLLKDFSTNKDERYMVSLAAFMSSKSASLPDVAKATALPLNKVVDFHNACAVMGLLRTA
jgi:hypothetical protein